MFALTRKGYCTRQSPNSSATKDFYIPSFPNSAFTNGRKVRNEKTAQPTTARLSRSSACSDPRAMQDAVEYTRQQGTTVPPARARVTLKRDTACTTRKVVPPGRTVSKVCHVCLLSLPHHREPSTRLASKQRLNGTTRSMPSKLQTPLAGAIGEST